MAPRLRRTLSRSSPRTWGCFTSFRFSWCRVFVFPTHVGVFPPLGTILPLDNCLPHARGGVSALIQIVKGGRESSPRTWGCFFRKPPKAPNYAVFPTHVGVFLPETTNWLNAFSLPHARGGVSTRVYSNGDLVQSSPRTWGCFSRAMRQLVEVKVFPTHVGVFLR